MDILPKANREAILDLMECASRVMGLRLCYHDLQLTTELPSPWKQHGNPACMEVKAAHQSECAAYCGQRMEKEIAALPHGSIHTCPFGHTDIAAPVWDGGVLAGILYAGVCWTGKGEPPREGLIIRPPQEWLEDRRVTLLALARGLEALLRSGRDTPQPMRREQIAEFIDKHLEEALRIEDLAASLSLSPSRTGRVVKELFKETFPQLLTRMRVFKAARILATTDLPAGIIAADTGFSDQSHFSRSFKSLMRMTPRAYRDEYGGTV